MVVWICLEYPVYNIYVYIYIHHQGNLTRGVPQCHVYRRQLAGSTCLWGSPVPLDCHDIAHRPKAPPAASSSLLPTAVSWKIVVFVFIAVVAVGFFCCCFFCCVYFLLFSETNWQKNIEAWKWMLKEINIFEVLRSCCTAITYHGLKHSTVARGVMGFSRPFFGCIQGCKNMFEDLWLENSTLTQREVFDRCVFFWRIDFLKKRSHKVGPYHKKKVHV